MQGVAIDEQKVSSSNGRIEGREGMSKRIEKVTTENSRDVVIGSASDRAMPPSSPHNNASLPHNENRLERSVYIDQNMHKDSTKMSTRGDNGSVAGPAASNTPLGTQLTMQLASESARRSKPHNGTREECKPWDWFRNDRKLITPGFGKVVKTRGHPLLRRFKGRTQSKRMAPLVQVTGNVAPQSDATNNTALKRLLLHSIQKGSNDTKEHPIKTSPTQRSPGRYRKSHRPQGICADDLKQTLEEMRKDEKKPVGFLIATQRDQGQSTSQERSRNSEEDVIHSQDSSSECGPPSAPNNSSEDSSSYHMSLSEQDSDDDIDSFTDEEVILTRAKTPACWAKLLNDDQAVEQNKSPPCNQPAPCTANQPQQHTSAPNQHSHTDTPNNNTHSNSSASASRILQFINAQNLLALAASDSDNKLARTFFTGRSQLSPQIEEVIRRALDKSVSQIRTMTNDAEIVGLLSEGNKTTDVLFQAMKEKRDLVPQCWIRDEKESIADEKSSDRSRQRNGCVTSEGGKSCETRIGEGAKPSVDASSERALPPVQSTFISTHPPNDTLAVHSSHASPQLSSTDLKDRERRQASSFVKEFSFLPPNV